jgi:hypothetical protein
MEESPKPLPLPIILGRPFMRTADTKICVKNGIVNMKVNGEKIEFKTFYPHQPCDLEIHHLGSLHTSPYSLFLVFVLMRIVGSAHLTSQTVPWLLHCSFL